MDTSGLCWFLCVMPAGTQIHRVWGPWVTKHYAGQYVKSGIDQIGRSCLSDFSKLKMLCSVFLYWNNDNAYFFHHYISVWFSLAQSVRSRTTNLFNLAVLIVRVQVRPRDECAKITYSLQIAQARVAPNVGCNKPFDPRESRLWLKPSD